MDAGIVVGCFVMTNTIDFLTSLKINLFELFYADINDACVKSAVYAFLLRYYVVVFVKKM